MLFLCVGQIERDVACVASVSMAFSALKIQMRGKWGEGAKQRCEGGGEEGRRKHLPANPTIMQNSHERRALIGVLTDSVEEINSTWRQQHLISRKNPL